MEIFIRTLIFISLLAVQATFAESLEVSHFCRVCNKAGQHE
jgi:hypothetical protein